MLSRLLAAIVFPALLVGVISWAQQSESTRSGSTLETETGQVDLAAVAGEYCSSDTMNGGLRLDLRGGRYELFHKGDVAGKSAQRVTGTATATGSVLELRPAPLRLPASYVPVGWGSRVYLIPEREIPRFCSSRWEPVDDCYSAASYFLVRTTNGHTAEGVVTGTRPAVCQASK
jgi:hypothetical protein